MHSHGRQAFVDANVTGTLNLLEEAVAAGVRAFVFTSTTSAFGDALSPPAPAPAAWITEDVVPVPKNIYGVIKVAAEDLCQLVQHSHGLPVLVLRTSRFFPERDDDESRRNGFDDLNLKVIELLYRRVDIQDVVDAHLLALQRAPDIGFQRLIISATSPFGPADLGTLRGRAAMALRRVVPEFENCSPRDVADIQDAAAMRSYFERRCQSLSRHAHPFRLQSALRPRQPHAAAGSRRTQRRA